MGQEVNMKKISIIIPCYNAFPYISDCMEALEKQTIGMDALEIILVNDASTDQTFQMLCKWEQKYPESIMVINLEENGKQGRARNIGIEYASGEFIGYVDIDDTIDPHMYDKLYKAAIQFECDLVICRSKKIKIEDKETESLMRTKENDWILMIDDEEKRKKFLNMDFNVAVWNKLYRKDLIIENEIYFPEGVIYEDIFFTTLIKMFARKVYVLEEELYWHFVWPNSTAQNHSDWRKRIDWLLVEEKKVLEMKKRGLYQIHRDYFEQEYVLNYLTLVKNLIMNYEPIPTELLVYLQERVLKLFPDFLQMELVQKLLKGKETEFSRIVLEGFRSEITKEYMERLVYSVFPRE